MSRSPLHFVSTCVLGASLLWSCASVQAQGVTAVGFTPGSIAVSETGAAIFTIPIQVPPGVAGMEPKLSLNFTSQGGNGPLGVGWSLGGLSAITRCPRTIAQDGAKGGINYDSNDRYCLDGQRLVAIAGAYGADGTEYRTERDSLARIVSMSTAGNGPAWFKVWTKSGQIMEYGNTADSRIEALASASVRVYALNKVSDTKSNTITVSYVEDASTGEYYPDRIQYTGNDGAGLPAGQSVQFSYQSRPDVLTSYAGGSKVTLTKLLSGVQTLVAGNPVKSYLLSYGVGTWAARIASVQECSPTAGAACLPPTTFQWQNGGGGNTSAATITPVQTERGNDWKNNFAVYPGDYNGDGIADLYLVGQSANYFCPGKAGPSSNDKCVQTQSGKNWKDNFAIHPGDYNGDGITDLYLVGQYGSYFCAGGPGLTTGASCVQTVFDNDWKNSFAIYPGDYNGDGITDLYLIGQNGSHFCAGGPVLTTSPNCVQTLFNNDWKSAFAIYPGDYNGDGITDLYLIGQNGSHFCAGQTLTISPNCVQTVFNNDWKSSFAIYPGDYNGDGITDLYLIGQSGSHFCAGGPGLTTGTNCVQTVFNNDWKNSFAIYPGDYNGDGITDLYLIGQSNSYFCAGQALTTSPNCVQTVFNNDWKNAYAIFPGDFNGDGITDLYLVGPAQYGSYFVSGATARPDVLTSVTSGLGAVTALTYKPLTDSTVYTKGSGSVYPTIDFQGPLYTVSATTTSNGIGGILQVTYNYSGAKIDLNGRGFLGFNTLQSTDPQGITSSTTFRQDWPYVGLPSGARKTVPSGGNNGLLSEVNNSYACINTQTGQSCVVAAGNVYFPYTSQSVENSWDLDGSGLPSVFTMTGSYDNYGNAGQIMVSTSDGHVKTTTNNYTNDTANWILGRLVRSQVTSMVP